MQGVEEQSSGFALPRHPIVGIEKSEERMRNDSAPAAPTYMLVEATEPGHFDIAEILIREYAGLLGVDLCFQDFSAELQQLARMYGPPAGCLLLAMDGGTPAACGGMRWLSEGVCEMKRLYVRDGARGASLGRRIAERLVDRAAALGYRTMRLDTLREMTPARNLYRSLGFREISPYYNNPLANPVYMELSLTRGEPDARESR